MNLHFTHDLVTGTICYSSIMMRFLPPPDKFTDYPKFQKWYKFGWIFVNYIAFNKNGVNGNGTNAK